MDELLFSAMDVPNEVEKLLKKIEAGVCKGMTDSERKAYDFGVSTVLNLTRQLLELDEEPAVHVPGLDGLEEMDVAELEKIFLK